MDPVSNEKEDTEPTIMADRRTSDSMDMVDDSVEGYVRGTRVSELVRILSVQTKLLSAHLSVSRVAAVGRGASRAAIIHERN